MSTRERTEPTAMESADAGSSDEYCIGREITDVGEDVVAAGPPVVPEMTGRLRLRAVDPTGGDPAMLASWFTRPHLAETWEQEWPESRWRADSAYRLAGDYSRPLIITMDGTEVGYLDLYRPARDEIARLYPADPHDMGFHIATADPALLGRGVISAWLADLAQAIFQTEPRCRRVVLDPAAGNAPIRRALTKHGWIDVGEFDVRPDRRIAMHILGRTPDDVPQL